MSDTFFVRSSSRLKAQWLKWLGMAVGIILLVALPRLTDLGGYLIVDEADRWHWAEEFYRALVAGNLRATLVGDGYPGIVPVWLETIWLLGESARRSVLEGGWFGEDGIYMLFHVWSRTEHLAEQRLPIVLFNSLLTLLIGWQVSKIYGQRVGLVALVLIALNPFYLADSRVNRAEAVITGLLTLSILFLVRYGQGGRRRWLVASGVMGGLSFLTKIQGLVVLPAVGMILFLSQLTRKEGDSDTHTWGLFLSRISDGVLWALVAVGAWVTLWPAMWVRPLDVLTLVFDYATRKAATEGVNLFFMGRHFYNEDPGPLFYPVVTLLRVTPLTMIGLILALLGGIRSLRSEAWLTRVIARGPGVPLLVYVLLYGGVMTLGSHKQDRYLMPVFPALDILAALGWIYVWDWFGEQWNSFRARRWKLAACGGWVAVQMISVVPYHPYYFPYFNPLVGDGAVGAKMLRVGWGEGMDLVADYLNTKPNAAELTVAARWQQYMLDFAGKTLPFDEGGQWTQADYVVLYVQQTQRMLDPSPGVIRYFQTRQPEHVITINRIEYAQIYASPFTRPAQPLVSMIPDKVALLGYRWEDPDGLQLLVIWENRGLTQPPLLMASLADSEAVPVWQPCQTVPGFEVAARTPGEVVETACDLSSDIETLPSGAFDLRFGLADDDGNVETFLFPQGWRSVIKEEGGTWRPAQWLESLDQIAQHEVPPMASTVDLYYRGQIRLVAYKLSSGALQPGQSLAITLYWQAVSPVEEDYIVFNHLFGLDGVAIGAVEEAPAAPTSRWLPGQIVTTTHQIDTDPALPTPALATLDIGLYDTEHRALPTTDRRGQRVPVTVTHLKFIPAAWPDEPPPVVDDVLFGDRLLLRGHAPFEENVVPGSTISLQLWWEALAPIDTDYTIFVHLLGAADSIVTQADGVPVNGLYPTSAWDVGERIIDTRSIVLPADLPAGKYLLIVGLYNPVDFSRLSLAGGGIDFFLLGWLTVNQ